MKEIGKKIYSMVKEKNSGRIKIAMKESILKERNKGKESIFGVMEAVMMENGLRINSTVKVYFIMKFLICYKDHLISLTLTMLRSNILTIKNLSSY